MRYGRTKKEVGNVRLTEDEQNDTKDHNAECGPDVALAQEHADQLHKWFAERHDT